MAGLVRKFADLLSGTSNGNDSDKGVGLLKALLLLPPVRALMLARQGGIESPLLLLKHTYGLKALKKFKQRLLDMSQYLAQAPVFVPPRGTSQENFNGKVLYAFHSCGEFDPSGYASRSISLVSALKRHGVEPTLVVRPGYPWDLPQHGSKQRVENVCYQGLDFHLYPDSEVNLRTPESEYIESYARKLAILARQEGSSVIHAASNYLNGTAAALAGKQLGIASIYEVRGLWHLTRAFSDPAYGNSQHYQYCEKREIAACMAADYVLTISDGLKSWLVQNGVPEQKISIAGNAATVFPDFDRQSARARIRNRYGIPESGKVIGYLGAIVEYEGLDALIRALSRTPPGRRPFLLFFGSGKRESALKLLAETLGVSDYTVWGGRVSPELVAECYAAMDMVALPRKDHQLTRLVPAIKPFEVLAHNKPLVVSEALAKALGSTLEAGHKAIDFDSIEYLDQLFEVTEPCDSIAAVPTWDDRARGILELYRKIGKND